MKRVCAACNGSGYVWRRDPPPAVTKSVRCGLSDSKVLDVIAAYEAETGFTLAQIATKRRWKYFVILRDGLIQRLDAETDLTLEAIGILLHRDHSTVIHSLKKTATKHTNGVTA